MSRDPWMRDLAALETAGRELLRQVAILRRQLPAPHDRIRALTIQREGWKLRRIADRMARRYEREAAARSKAARVAASVLARAKAVDLLEGRDG